MGDNYSLDDFAQWQNDGSITCPRCGSAEIAKILYGNVKMTPSLKEALGKNHIKLGGIQEEKTTYACNTCGFRW